MPSHRVVLGALPALRDAFAEAVFRARQHDALAPLAVLVDNSLLKLQLPRDLARRGVAQFNVRYYRPDEFARAIASRTSASPLPRLTRDSERFLVRDVAAQAGGYFKAIAGRDGLAAALGRLFRELELGGFTASSLAAAMDERGRDERTKHGQLARLYASFLERRAGMRTRADDYAAAAGAAPFEGPLFIFGVWALAELQLRVVEHVAEESDVTLFLPHSSSDADQAHAVLRERLMALGAQIEVLGSGAVPPPASPAPVQLSLMEQPGSAAAPSVAAMTAAIPDMTPAVPTTLLSAPDTVREVWEAARWCLARAREGIRFHEMAVVYRNADPYRALVDEIFREAGIDAYLHDGRVLSAHPWGRRLVALLELVAAHEKFERARVMEFLTETRIPRATRRRYEDPAQGIFVRPSEWEAYSREAGVIEGAEQWRTRLERLAREKREKARDERFDYLVDVAGRIEVFARFVADLHAALAAHPVEATWDEHLRYARDLAGRYADDTGAILDALEDLKLIAQVRERVTYDEFLRAVRDDLDWRDASAVLGEPVRAFGRQGVGVLDASSLRHLRFRAVWLLGVAERAWPPPPRPDPLLLEHERRAINNAGPERLPLRTEPDEEALQFRIALDAASERLAISYARADAGQSGRYLPSYFFRAVAEAVAGTRLSLDELEASPCVDRIEAGRLSPEELADSLSIAEYDRGLVRRSMSADDSAFVAAVAETTPAFASAMRSRGSRWSPALTEFDGVAAADDARAAAAARSPFVRGEPVSASRLETYAACPYRYFLRYCLGIEPIEEPESADRMDHLQRGSLIHEILERFLTRIGRDDPPREERREEHLRLLMEIARECGDERVRRGVAGLPLVWQIDRQAMEEDLDRWYGYEMREIARSGLLPGAFEARFGALTYAAAGAESPYSTDDPFELPVGNRSIRLHGRIDRVDWDDGGTRFRVIDYKTGRYTRGDFLDRGESLQLPVYLHAAARMVGLPPESGEAQYFYATSRGDFKRRVIGGATMKDRHASLVQVLTTIADGVDAGYFAPNPLHSHCTFCDYKDVCDRRIEKIMERKSGDPRGAAYRALEDVK
jgi:CRISPR/Cas system-associated exonuclease Cas4 (RecB family)